MLHYSCVVCCEGEKSTDYLVALRRVETSRRCIQVWTNGRHEAHAEAGNIDIEMCDEWSFGVNVLVVFGSCSV